MRRAPLPREYWLDFNTCCRAILARAKRHDRCPNSPKLSHHLLQNGECVKIR